MARGALLAVLLVPGLCSASPLPPELEARFATIDANGDGMIRFHEAWADPRLLWRFRLADVNHDGDIDREEFLAFVTTRA
jgi:Ca2+-binding EF-hand superfamily protein